jgi:predicted transcriptional regulator
MYAVNSSPFTVEAKFGKSRKTYITHEFQLLVVMEMEDKEKIVLEAMEKAGKPVRPGEVAKMANLPKDEVSKIIKNLKKKGKVTSPKRCYYAPAK